ncbi:purine-nucleoside phosphorylase [Stieleria varia]|uniref:Purine nucleoside phosphorylase n=1 Tax=Stieleria varia TaxID=2528005 RepID=A0A5C6B134_9BACT|nr:purine-nucleoside phosphorylase [Stieleria varia]TWU05507.1 Purine nucleoside phosphorylase 1 [Stieleria varia]
MMIARILGIILGARRLIPIVSIQHKTINEYRFVTDRESLSNRVQRTMEFVQSRTAVVPETAIILGSGLGGLADRIETPIALDYCDIPCFAKSTASGHRGQLIVGTLNERPVVAMAGRFHRYEGWSNADVGFPVRVMHALGARTLIVSNAAGGVNPKLRVGDIIVIRDHINWLHQRGLGSSDQPTVANPADWPLSLGRQRMGELYDSGLASIAMRSAVRNGFTAYEGTYLATLGPTYETRAEYRMMRRIGADVAGMSTVPEVLAAAELGMQVLGLSLVSNVAQVDHGVKADHAEVLQAGQAAATKMEQVVSSVVGSN